MGYGVKEQLWALLEFMEEGDNDEIERIFCPTDVHKANTVFVHWVRVQLLPGEVYRAFRPC